MNNKKKLIVNIVTLLIIAGVILAVYLLANSGIDVVGYLKKLHGG